MALIVDLYKIKENDIEVGNITLWQYEGQIAPHIELDIKPEYQNQGIPTFQLEV